MISSPSLAVKQFVGREFPAERMPNLYFEMFNKELGMIAVNSIPDVFREKKPCLVELSKTIGKEKVIAMLQLFIVSIDNFLDLNKRMNQDNIAETASLVYTKYKQLTLTDIVFVFNQAKMGKYGPLKYSINGQQIMFWFDDHFEERCGCAARVSLSEHEALKSHDSKRSGERTIKSLNDKYKNEIQEYRKTHKHE